MVLFEKKGRNQNCESAKAGKRNLTLWQELLGVTQVGKTKGLVLQRREGAFKPRWARDVVAGEEMMKKI